MENELKVFMTRTLKEKKQSCAGLSGEDNYNVKYSDKEIIKICELLQQGFQPEFICNSLEWDYNTNNRSYIIAIKNRKRRTDISCNYNFPEITPSNIKYTDKQVHSICKLIESNIYIPSKEIANKTGIEYNKAFIKFISKIKNKQSRTDISSQYNF